MRCSIVTASPSRGGLSLRAGLPVFVRAAPAAGVPLQQLLDGGERAADRVQGRRLAGRRRADQRLPEDERLGP
jgi:hypothetical protein